MKQIAICALISITLLSACKKNYQGVEEPSFDVTTDSLEYNVNQPIVFKVTGNADRVTFFSGEEGHNYEFKDRVKVVGKPEIQFTSKRQKGLNPGVADSTFKFFISKNFNGKYNAVDVGKASWIDITNRAEFSTGTSTFHVPSGKVDISDLVPDDSAVYISFYYHDAQTASDKREWTIYDLQVDNVLPDSSVVRIANWKDMIFTPVNIQNPARIWYVYQASAVLWGGPASDPETEFWLISKPFFLNRVSRDAGVSIRDNPKALLTDYTFDGFTKPGVYTVVFEAYNATKWQTKKIVKKITLTIK